MAPSKLRQAIGAVKDHTSISLAKVGSSASLSDLDVAIVKATRHEEYPAEERHIREILSLTCYSRAYVGACVNTLSRRLGRTKNWVVALKTLMLIHRLLKEGDSAYEQEIFFATRRGTRLLNMSDFRDTLRSNSWDYSAFVRTYALYLDEQLEFKMLGRRGKRSSFAYRDDEEKQKAGGVVVVRTTPVRDMRNDHIFNRAHHLMQLIESFLACKPTGSAKTNRVVVVALYSIVKESFQLYYDITEIMGILIDRFMELDIPESIKVHEIFCRVSNQYDEVDSFYSWCKTIGVARSSEYPEEEPVEKAEAESKHDTNTVKALPAPEEVPEKIEEQEGKEQVEEVKQQEKKKTQDEGDLLNLYDDAPSQLAHGDQLALALFDGAPMAGPAGPSPWEAFADTSDWETALVQSVSHLSNQKSSLPGGFDAVTLEGMYQQAAMNQAVVSSGLMATGSASSVALGSAGRPAMLALPAPPTQDVGGANTATVTDPFAASLAVAPPAYVQMSDLGKKQALLVEEQIMWHQYSRDGRQGQVGLASIQPNYYPYGNGGYTRTS